MDIKYMRLNIGIHNIIILMRINIKKVKNILLSGFNNLPISYDIAIISNINDNDENVRIIPPVVADKPIITGNNNIHNNKLNIFYNIYSIIYIL